MSDAAESVGWQRLKDDVFRAPNEAMLLAIATGIGAQITAMVYLSVAILWFFYVFAPIRIFIGIASVVTFASCGYINGFMTSRILKFFQLADWITSGLVAAMIFPAYILLTLSLGDIVESAMGSSAAVPFGEGLLHYIFWWALDGPAAAYGAYKGFMSPLELNPEIGKI